MPLPIYQSDQKPMDYLNEVIQSRPDREQQYQGALTQMKDAYAKRSVEGDDAAQWGALAKGFAKPADNFWQSLANAGGAKADVVAGIEARDLGLGREAATMHYKAATDLLKQDDLLTRAMAARMMGGNSSRGGRNLIKQGEIWLEKQMDGSWKPIAAGESALVDADYRHGMDQAAKIIDTDDPTVLHNHAIAYVEHKKQLRAGSPTVAAQGNGQNPPLTPVQLPGHPAPTPAAQPDVSVAPTVDRASMLPQLLKEYENALSAGNGVRARELQDAINAMRNAPTGPAEPAAPQMPPVRLKTAESQGEMEARGKERGKSMEQHFQELQNAGTTSSDLNGQLNIMKELFIKHGDNIPSGQLAPLVSSIKSGLGTFGIELGGTGASDVITAMGNLGALKFRNSDGNNLLPGAMTDRDVKVMQSVFPNIGNTKEGRLLQIEIIQARLRMQAELAKAAREMYQRDGKLGPGWHDVAAEIAKKNPFLDPRRIAAMEAYARLGAKGAK